MSFQYDGVLQKFSLPNKYPEQVLPEPQSNLPEEFVSKMYKICLRCWKTNPSERPTFDELIKLFKVFERESSLYASPELVEMQLVQSNSNNSEHYGNHFAENRTKLYTS